MSFTSDTEILIKNKDNKIKIFKMNSGLICYDIDSNFNESNLTKVMDGNYYFSDIYIDIDDNDIIYGIVNNKGKLLTFVMDNDVITTTTTIKYDYNDFFVKFPSITRTHNDTHIFFYSLNKYNPTIFFLNHIYCNKKQSKKNKFNLSSHGILTNFVVTWNSNIPTIFYYDIVSGVEEIFVSTFNLHTLNWSIPYQITSSKKNKIYLSVLRYSDSSYHILFSENNDSKYYCQYINGSFKDNDFYVNKSISLRKDTMCLFPTLIINNSIVYAQWVEYNTLYSCKSIDLGKSWSIATPHNYWNNYDTVRYEFKSNYHEDNNYLLSSVFSRQNCYNSNIFIPNY